MHVEPLAIPEVKLITPVKIGDNRGFFSEVYNKTRFAEAGIAIDFVQENHSYSADIGTVRGIHFQTPPAAQDKLVRVPKGRILDVVVDLRRGSPTYGKWVSAEISADNWRWILAPIGFGHGFVTLEPNTEVIYMVSAHYSKANDAAIRWDDPDLAIDWPIRPEDAVLSQKDRDAMAFADFESPF
jgi:dTDP-4-dehydrorhamnose 3,5-epimerase